MKKRGSGLGTRGSGVLLGLTVLAAAPVASQTSLSLYTDGRALVRQTLPRPLERGRNALTLSPMEGLHPASLFSPDTTVSVVSATVRFPTPKQRAFAAAIGQTLAFVRDKGDTVRATVVRADPPQFRLPDGRILLEQPGEPLFPPSVVRTTSEVSLVLEAAQARPRTEIAYIAHGARWEAVYACVLGRGRAALSGTATITSGMMRAESAAVQLVAGGVRRIRPPGPPPPQPLAEEGLALARGRFVADSIVVGAPEEAVGETHVYDLPGRHTIEPGVPSTVALFPRGDAPYGQELVVPGVLAWRGWIGPQPGEPNRVPVQVWYTFRRARGTPFGDRPLPAGTMRLYQPDSAGRVQLVGEATIGHTPAGRELRVQSGDAFDVTAERVQTDFNQEQLPPPRRGMAPRQRVTATYRVTIANAKGEAVTVDVREARFGDWRIVESSIPAEKLSATEVRFRLPVPGGGEAALTYTVQVES